MAAAPIPGPPSATGSALMGTTNRITLFRSTDDHRGEHSHIVETGVDDTVRQGFARWAEAGLAEGAALTCIATIAASPDSPRGTSLTHVRIGRHFLTPRHSHDVDCIYYVLAGSLRVGGGSLGRGDGMQVPAGEVYALEAGPEGAELLEFRSAIRFGIHYVQNDAAHWERIVGAAAANSAAWQAGDAPAVQDG